MATFMCTGGPLLTLAVSDSNLSLSEHSRYCPEPLLHLRSKDNFIPTQTKSSAILLEAVVVIQLDGLAFRGQIITKSTLCVCVCVHTCI